MRRPSIQKYMMKTPNEQVNFRTQLHNSKAHQGRLSEIEPSLTIMAEERRQLFLLSCVRNTLPILILPYQFHMLAYNLKWLFQFLPQESSA